LPETQIGLLPAWGGSTRLPRLIGLPKALDIILAGKTLAAKPALKMGLVDELAPVEYLVETAVRKLQAGKPQRPSRWLVNNALARSVIASRARESVRQKTRDNYPAVLKALEVVTCGVSEPLIVALTLERDGILELAQGEACHNLLRVFQLQERAKKLTPPGAGPAAEVKPVKRAAVIGAGVMGAGIAQWLSARQLPVILRDINAELVAKGMAGIARVYQEGVKRHVFTAGEARDGLDRIQPAPLEVPLRHADIVIEAAVETLEVKQQIFKRLDELMADEAMLATNTSALSVAEIAAVTRRPERVVGLHFFNPVHRMQLVEVVATPRLAPEILQRAVRFVQQIGKLPVVVRDSPGFLVNRILVPYLVEAGNLFAAGAELAAIDEAMLDFGMPMGPLRLLDEVGVDVALPISRRLGGCFPGRLQVPELLGKMVQAGWFGRKRGAGFYIHNKSNEPQPNPQIKPLVGGATARALSRGELQERMVLLMLNEAARCLEEEIVAEPADVDFAMIMGTGFAPFRGGPLRFADSRSAKDLVAAMQRLADSGAAHFAPCESLRRMAADGRKFYPDKGG
jgi:3-hydroxyacyl-CoA dehydrogenase/enoyl-CoA hydratase/3-hydroxybutyryl-CoA epimerase